MDIAQESLRLHEEWQGKLDTVPKMEIKTREDLALAYTPGVAEPCKKIGWRGPRARLHLHAEGEHHRQAFRTGRRYLAWATSVL